MTGKSRQTILVSPETRSPLLLQDDHLMTEDARESFPVEQGITLLISRNRTDALLDHEMDVFDNIPVQGVSYFRQAIYKRVVERLCGLLPDGDLRFSELGGGEGHFARYLKEQKPRAEVFVCDVSIEALKRAPYCLLRVCADITRPVFAPQVLQAAAFWVSLHHLPKERYRPAFEEAFRALDSKGILIVFEPNAAFFLRKMLYKSTFRNDVYFDEQESAVDFGEIATLALEAGFEELEIVYLNPPYSFDFVRKLKRWYLYFPLVEILYWLDRCLSLAYSLFARPCKQHKSFRKFVTLYGMALFRKPG